MSPFTKDEARQLMDLGLIIPALQGALVDSVHLAVSVPAPLYWSYPDQVILGTTGDPSDLKVLPSDGLVEAVSEAVIAGAIWDLQPYLWFYGAANSSMATFEKLNETDSQSYVTHSR